MQLSAVAWCGSVALLMTPCPLLSRSASAHKWEQQGAGEESPKTHARHNLALANQSATEETAAASGSKFPLRAFTEVACHKHGKPFDPWQVSGIAAGRLAAAGEFATSPAVVAAKS